MRFILVAGLVVVCGQVQAAAPAKAPPPVSLSIKTAGDLADACTISPKSKIDFARLNFCNGFAQGVLQTNGQTSGTKICLPSPAPKRSETMKEFATWVRADVARKDAVASVGFLQFMAGRFPCP